MCARLGSYSRLCRCVLAVARLNCIRMRAFLLVFCIRSRHRVLQTSLRGFARALLALDVCVPPLPLGDVFLLRRRGVLPLRRAIFLLPCGEA